MATNISTMAERIRTLRKEKKLTQLELAQLLNVTDKAVSKWESSEGNPDISLLSRLSEIFGITIDYLLTGKVQEEKILLMSKAELCAKTDDLNLVDEMVNNPPQPDEKGLTLFDYIFKYSSKKVFKKLSDANKLSLFVKTGNAVRSHYLGNRLEQTVSLVSDKFHIKHIPLSDIIEMYILSDSLGNLPQIGLNKLSDATYHEWDDKLIRLALSKDLPAQSKKIIFSAHDNNNGNWTTVYSKLAEAAVLNGNVDEADSLYQLIKGINENALLSMQDLVQRKRPYIKIINKDNEDIETAKQKHQRSASTSESEFIKVVSRSRPDDYGYNNNQNTVSKIFMVCFSKKTLEHLKEHDSDKLALFNEINKLAGGFYFDDKSIKIAEMKVKNTHSDDDIFVFSCMDGDLLNIQRLILSEDLNLIKKALFEKPIHYYEIVSKIAQTNDYKKIFRFAVDSDNSDLAYAMLFGKYELIEAAMYKIATRSNHSSNIGYARNRVSLSNNIEETQNQNLDYCTKLILKQSKDSIEKRPNHYSIESKYTDGKSLEQFLLDCRNAVIKEISWKVDKAKLVEELTEDYFLSKLDRGEKDLVIIKLCSLLEAKLKVSYKLSGDLIDMLNTYCSNSFFGDDGWGYTVQTDSYTPDILHRLRIMRNNIAHSEKNNVKPLNEKELLDCVKHIISMR